MKLWRKFGVVLLLLAAVLQVSAQSASEAQEHGFWTDATTGLIWVGKDNGKDINWHNAMKYCRDLRLGGYSDWRLPTLAELKGIYDRSAVAPGRAGPGTGRAFSWHIKGNLFLTGVQWSTSQRVDDRGRPNGFAWYFDFNNGVQNDDDAGRITGRFANYGRRALCVRGPEK